MTNKAQIENLIAKWEETKNSYFWKFNGNAQTRAKQEAKYEFDEEFEYKGDTYHVKCSVNSSRNNVYVTKTITVNGEKKNLRALKKVLSELSD